MKKIFKYLFAIITFAFGFILISCDVFTPPTIESIQITEDAPEEILINSFNYEDYSIVLYYSNNAKKTIPLTEEMLNPIEYLDAIKKEGKHVLTITYQGLECTYEFTVCKYEFTNVYIESQTITYDGEYHFLEVKGNIPENTTIEFIDKNYYKNVNEYKVSARLTNESYQSKTIEGTLNIVKADYDVGSIKFEDATYVYDGEAKSIEVTGVDSNVKVTYSIAGDNTNKRTEAGRYEVKAHFESSANYNNIPDMTAILTIEKATYDMSPYQFVDKTTYYTGDTFDMHISNEQSLPFGVTVSYIGLNDAINAGTYEIIARFQGDLNYNDIPDLKANLTIKPQAVGLTGIYLDSKSVVYDGKEHSIEYTGTKPNSIISNGYTIYNQYGDLIYDSTSLDLQYRHKAIDVGTYIVYAHFSYRDTVNYADIEPLSATLIITKADITDITIENESKEYIPGVGQSLTVKTSMNGITATPSIANPVDPGDYLITYTFSLSDELAKNYNVPDPITRTLSITKRNIFADKYTQNKYYATYDGKAHGINIELSGEEATWIKPYLFYYNEENEENPFEGFTEPGTYLIFATFTIDTDLAPANYQDYYYIPSRTSAYLTINKKQIEFDEDWLLNRKSCYNITKGTTVAVTLNESEADSETGKTGLQEFLEANEGIEEGDYTIVYRDNYATDVDYYTGSLDIIISKDKEKYFDSLYNFEFHYAIKKDEDNGEEVNPSILQKTFTYDGKSHSIILSDIPEGISIMYEGDENALTLPGSKNIIILFHPENEIAKWYYDFPGLIKSMSGDPQLIVQLTVLHIDYIPELEIPNYYYELDSEDRTISVKNPVMGVNVTFEYDDEERKDVGTYNVSVNVKVTNTDLLKIYNETSSFRSSFSIYPSDYRFSFAGLSALYDGNKHNIIVTGIDKEIELGYLSYVIEDAKGNKIDGYTDVGIYNLFVKFTNNSKNYNNVANQALQLTIETSKVKTQDLVDYVENTTYAKINQLETVYNYLNSIIDTTPFNVTYKVDYYKAAENPLYPEDPLFHGEGENEDYTFTQFTTADTGFVLFEFQLTFKNGYESKDLAFVDSYHGFIRLKVMPVNEYDVSSVFENMRNNLSITQGDTLDNAYLSSISNLNYSYTCEYLNGDNPYDTERYPHSTGTNEEGFNFLYNTFENRKVKITLSIPATENYLFYDGIHSSTSIEETFYFDVNINNIIDIYDVIDALATPTSIEQFSVYEDYISSYYQNDLYTTNYIIKDDKGNQISSKEDDGYVSEDGTYIVEITLESNYNRLFLNNNDYTFKINQELTVIPVLNVKIGDYVDSLNDMDLNIYELDSLWDKIVKNREIPEGLNINYVLVDVDGTNVSGNIKDLEGTYAKAYVFRKDPTQEEENHVLLYLTLSPVDGYIMIDKDNNVNNTSTTLNFEFDYHYRYQISYYDIYKTINWELERRNYTFDQYTKYSDYLWILNNYKKYVDDGILNLEFYLNYKANGKTITVVDSFEDLNQTINLEYDENGTFELYYKVTSLTETVVITDNPLIEDKYEKSVGWNKVSNNEIRYLERPKDENLTSKINEAIEKEYISMSQYTNLVKGLNTNILDYVSENGPKAISYTVELVDRETKAIDKSFVKITNNISTSYTLCDNYDNQKLLKVTIKFENSGDLVLLNADGNYENNPEYSIYVDVTENQNSFNINDTKDYTIPTYTQFNNITDTINSINISEKINIKSWKVVVNNVTYSGNTSSNVSIVTNHGTNGTLTLTYELSDLSSDTFLVEDTEVLDVTTFEQSYTFNITYLKQISLTKLNDFKNSSNQYYLVGQKPTAYSTYLLNGVEGITYTHNFTTYETEVVEQLMGNDGIIKENYLALNINLTINAKDGYYFDVTDNKPITTMQWSCYKAVKKPKAVSTSYLKSLEDVGISTFRGNVVTITNYQDYVDGVQFTYNIMNGLRSYQQVNHLDDAEFLAKYTLHIVTWKIEITASSDYAIRFCNDDEGVINPIGYRDSYPSEYGSGEFNVLVMMGLY